MSRVALITGGVVGIGAASTEALAVAGNIAVATYGHNDAQAKEFAALTQIPVRKWDIADYDACAAGVAEVEEAFGPIDILVNNAGVTADAPFHKMEPKAWQRVIDTNLTGCFNMCRAVINRMRERKFGRIINVGSMNGQCGQFGQANYAAAKAGLVGLSKCLAMENASRGITVNVVSPGYTDTAMLAAVAAPIVSKIVESIPLGRLATPAEIAQAVVYLASDAAAYITGSTLSINGGRNMA